GRYDGDLAAECLGYQLAGLGRLPAGLVEPGFPVERSMEQLAVRLHPYGKALVPLLRVDRVHSRRADDQVIDLGLAAGDGPGVQRPEPAAFELLELHLGTAFRRRGASPGRDRRD